MRFPAPVTLVILPPRLANILRPMTVSVTELAYAAQFFLQQRAFPVRSGGQQALQPGLGAGTGWAGVTEKFRNVFQCARR